MLKIHQQQKSIYSGFIAGLYLLLLVFSPYLHEHHAKTFGFSDSKIQKFEKLLQDNINTANDCQACHFLTTNISIAPQDFQFEFQKFCTTSQSYFSKDVSNITREKYLLPSRGPPSDFML